MITEDMVLAAIRDGKARGKYVFTMVIPVDPGYIGNANVDDIYTKLEELVMENLIRLIDEARASEGLQP